MKRRSFLLTSLLASAGTLIASNNTWKKENLINQKSTVFLILGHLNKQDFLPSFLPLLNPFGKELNLKASIYSELFLENDQISRENALQELGYYKDNIFYNSESSEFLFGNCENKFDFKTELEFIKRFRKEKNITNESIWVNAFDTNVVHYNYHDYLLRLKTISNEIIQIVSSVFLEESELSNSQIVIIAEHGLNNHSNEMGGYDHHRVEAKSSFGIVITKSKFSEISYVEKSYSYKNFMNHIQNQKTKFPYA